VRRGRGRPKLTWEEAIKRNLKGWIFVEISVWIEMLGK
jgi:hypothetical protein